MASSGYTTMTLVGGQASGESYAIADLVGSIRIPIRQPSIFLVNKADLREAVAPEIGYIIYNKRQYRDRRGIVRTFLICDNITKEEAEIELYLLGITDVDGNFER